MTRSRADELRLLLERAKTLTQAAAGIPSLPGAPAVANHARSILAYELTSVIALASVLAPAVYGEDSADTDRFLTTLLGHLHVVRGGWGLEARSCL